MAFTNAPSTRPIDAVRLLVGDISTSTARELLTDNSYTYFIAQTPNHFAAGALAANSLASLFAADGTEKSVGDLRIKRAQAAEYTALAKQLSKMSALKTAPYAGGISKDDKRTVEDDTDRVEPAFRVRQFDNPSALNPFQASTST